MSVTHPIGDFLRARRARVQPEDVGLPRTSHRRVAGLRREELALLAGVSVDYYERLERGRDRHPSEQVLRALARVLMLDDDEHEHLMSLAGHRPAAPSGPGSKERTASGVAALISSWPLTPAFVWGRRMDVLAANHLAVALSPMFRPGSNLARAFFLDPEARGLYPQWPDMAPRVAALLRRLTTVSARDTVLDELVSELLLGSAEFARLWARHEVRRKVGGPKLFRHPAVGDLRLHREALEVPGSGQTLIAYHASPGSEAERSLTLLASAGTRDASDLPGA
ncbi:helix-turn-helix transcriptional regulator [Streptomyces misionensis]|uniref:helix-turn-helix transcriptional regulator n=1 Tax=Streptomyces misionensis TaxID=67331 RepID=UPI00396B578B